mmetsp:Transcript_33601/g.68205  ORF Transcript_33601/g.68205 Transcript_33601/m.68205 type:complete len:81 (-) Transcript_33601:1560-1802(-)
MVCCGCAVYVCDEVEGSKMMASEQSLAQARLSRQTTSLTSSMRDVCQRNNNMVEVNYIPTMLPTTNHFLVTYSSLLLLFH